MISGRNIVAAALAAAAIPVVWRLADPGWAGNDLLPALAIALGVAGALSGLAARRQAAALRRELDGLARSVDTAFKNVAAREERLSLTMAEAGERLQRQVDRLAARQPGDAPTVESDRPPLADNVVALPGARKNRPQPREDDLPGAIRRAVATGTIELSLQPIVSTEGQAAGFEAHAHVEFGEGRTADIRRPPPAARADAARFERLFALSAVEATRRRLGDAGAAMPVHVPISEALLSDRRELAAVADVLTLYPRLARIIVVSLPAADAAGGAHAAALSQLSRTGVRIAAEAGRDDAGLREIIARRLAHCVKLPAAQLFDRDEPRAGATLAEAARTSGVTLIATGVASDEDAMAALDAGIDLMTGERFSGPRLLRPDAGGADERAAQPADRQTETG